MAQVFWEQIRNELPAAGEFLTGSLNISGSFSSTGSILNLPATVMSPTAFRS